MIYLHKRKAPVFTEAFDTCSCVNLYLAMSCNYAAGTAGVPDALPAVASAHAMIALPMSTCSSLFNEGNKDAAEVRNSLNCNVAFTKSVGLAMVFATIVLNK